MEPGHFEFLPRNEHNLFCPSTTSNSFFRRSNEGRSSAQDDEEEKVGPENKVMSC